MLRIFVRVPFPPPVESVTTETVKYGLLYNFPVVTDARKITSSDSWDLMTLTESQTLNTYISSNAGKLKETGFVYWDSPNTGALNDVGFFGRGGGYRNYATTFTNLRVYSAIWTKTTSTGSAYTVRLLNDSATYNPFFTSDQKNGNSIRFIRAATADELLLPDGLITATYAGNNGRHYRCTKIGVSVYTADNICETKYRNGDDIPEVTDGAAWAALTTGAWCAYNNNHTNI